MKMNILMREMDGTYFIPEGVFYDRGALREYLRYEYDYELKGYQVDFDIEIKGMIQHFCIKRATLYE